jgi:hypothetical protein
MSLWPHAVKQRMVHSHKEVTAAARELASNAVQKTRSIISS